jgi:hypothetical protein
MEKYEGILSELLLAGSYKFSWAGFGWQGRKEVRKVERCYETSLLWDHA